MITSFWPIISCKTSTTLEHQILGQNTELTWKTIQKVGQRLADQVLTDFKEINATQDSFKIAVLCGKGHNSADALIAASTIQKRHPNSSIDVIWTLDSNSIRPLTQKAFDLIKKPQVIDLDQFKKSSYDITLDGIFGMSFKPPAPDFISEIAQIKNSKLRAAVDIPSGLTWQAEFTYATGFLKDPLFDPANKDKVGRIRFVDVGFYDHPAWQDIQSNATVINPSILEPLKELRPAQSSKFNYGHLFIIAGSQAFPGAMLMATKAAVQSGAGLVTVFAPESIVNTCSPKIPEAMWIPCPETPEGTLADGTLDLIKKNQDRAQAILIGPGLSSNTETIALVKNIVEQIQLPTLLDASALHPEVFANAPFSHPVLATPHPGEFRRIAGDSSLEDWYKKSQVTTLLKTYPGQIIHQDNVYHNIFGGPVLARGGSGDILSGICSGLLAQNPTNPSLALAQGTLWHSLAADQMAQNLGHVPVKTTDLLPFLQKVLH